MGRPRAAHAAVTDCRSGAGSRRWRIARGCLGCRAEKALGLGEIQKLTAPGALPGTQGGEQRRRAVHPADGVAEGHMHHRGGSFRSAGQVRQPRRLLHGRTVGAIAAPRAVGAEGRHGDHHQLGIHLRQHRVVQTEFWQDAGGVILHNDIRERHQPFQQRGALGGGKVEGDGALVAVDHVEGGILLGAAGIDPLLRGFPTTPPVETHTAFHFDDVRTHVRQMAGGKRAGPTHGQIDHPHPGEQRRTGHGSRSAFDSPSRGARPPALAGIANNRNGVVGAANLHT